MMENVFQKRTFKDRINVINKSFPNFCRVQCRSYSSARISIHINFCCGWRCWASHGTFGESKRSLKSHSDEHKRSARNCNYGKNEIPKHCWEADHNFNWDQKKVIDRESRLIPWQIKENIHSLKNSNHINKLPYMLPEI